MKKVLFFVSILFLIQSCIPLRIAPNISDYKIEKGKKFKRGLPKQQLFIFEDPKKANEFYYYVDTKYQLNSSNAYDNIPFVINNVTYYFSFYEVEIKDKHIDLLSPAAAITANAALGRNGERAEIFNEDPKIRKAGNYYIAINAYDNLGKDCLDKNSLSRPLVLEYLRALKKEYLATHNYNEVLFKN